MKHESYFKKNGFIYGVSSKYQFGWSHCVIKFDNLNDAEQWLCAEEYDFRERELMSKTAATKLVGKARIESLN